ncbi:MAG: DegT/DnrJ/EryC1/StrS family aminotransferase [Polyangiaceae bacterium]
MSTQEEFIPGARPTFPEEDLPGVLAEIGEVLRGGRLILGPKLRKLEEAWAARVGTKFAIGVSSCTAALEIAYRHVGVAGREVIVPTNTFVATANAAIAAGANVVFCDMNADDYCIDVDQALAKITPKTAALVVVHISGFIPARIDELVAACHDRGVKVIEDCAHAHGAKLQGREAGAFGDVGCFSLYPTKVLTCGVGGVVTANDESVAALARSLRHHGQGASLEEIVHAGNDWMLDEVRAVLAFEQLRRLDDFLGVRRRIAARYDGLLKSDARVTLPKLAAGLEPAFYKYPLVLPDGTDAREIRRVMYERDHIEVGSLYYPPCHLMPVFRNAPADRVSGVGPGQQPVSEQLLARQVCLPMHARVTEEQADRSVEALSRALGG